MDLIMPGIDGAETTHQIMQFAPCVILVVTATTVGNRGKVFEAMGYGALDAVNTPVLGPGEDLSGAEPLIQKLRTVSRLAATHGRSGPRMHHAMNQPADTSSIPVVAIGASTGGPQAVSKVLASLPAQFPAAVLIVQHVDEQFTPGLAKWLQHNSALPVSIAKHGEHLKPGGVWIAGSKDHLIYDAGVLKYTSVPEDASFRPSVDVLFLSLAELHSAPRIGVLLTGMGRDGAEGLLAMRTAGALTIAQDEATCVVYGMPRAGAELNAAVDVLPIAEIGPRIVSAIRDGRTHRTEGRGAQDRGIEEAHPPSSAMGGARLRA
jgi:two-component system response regulator WspF